MKSLYALTFPQPAFSAQERPSLTCSSSGSQRPIRRDPLNGRWFSLCAMPPKPMIARVSWFDGAVSPLSTPAGTMENIPNAAALFMKSRLFVMSNPQTSNFRLQTHLRPRSTRSHISVTALEELSPNLRTRSARRGHLQPHQRIWSRQKSFT